MNSSKKVLILVNSPHKPQMLRLKELLEQKLPEYSFKIISQSYFRFKIGIPDVHAIITYNKNKFKKRTLDTLINYAENGGKLIALHHNISSMHIHTPRWLAWTCVKIQRKKSVSEGQNAESVKYPWSVIDGGTAYLIPLDKSHYITTHGMRYEDKAPEISPSIAIDEEGYTFSHEFTPQEIEELEKGPKVPALKIENTEYFINHVLLPSSQNGCSRRKVLMSIYFIDPKSGRRFYSPNALWLMPRGKGVLFYSMIGHAVTCYTEDYSQLIANMISYSPRSAE